MPLYEAVDRIFFLNGVAQAAGDDGKVLLFFTVYLAENGDGQELEGIEGCRGIAGQAEDYRTCYAVSLDDAAV